MQALDEIVRRMVEEHEGGEKFFENLDMEIQKDHSIVEQLYNKLIDKHQYNIVVSGKFGVFFNNYIHAFRPTYHYLMSIILVNGGLRKGECITDLTYLADKINGKSFVFVDDSFYSGKTRNAVQKEIERHDGHILQSFVAYDGSPVYDDSVESLYRYYGR